MNQVFEEPDNHIRFLRVRGGQVFVFAFLVMMNVEKRVHSSHTRHRRPKSSVLDRRMVCNGRAIDWMKEPANLGDHAALSLKYAILHLIDEPFKKRDV